MPSADAVAEAKPLAVETPPSGTGWALGAMPRRSLTALAYSAGVSFVRLWTDEGPRLGPAWPCSVPTAAGPPLHPKNTTKSAVGQVERAFMLVSRAHRGPKH